MRKLVVKLFAMDKIVVFDTFYNPIEANIVKARLIDSGIQCFLSDENTITINPLYTQALGGVRLRLFERDVELARSILEQDMQIPEEANEEIVQPAQNAITCSSCGSGEVGYVQATKKRFGLFTTIMSLLLMIYPFKVKKTHHCFNCGHEFDHLSEVNAVV